MVEGAVNASNTLFTNIVEKNTDSSHHIAAARREQ